MPATRIGANTVCTQGGQAYLQQRFVRKIELTVQAHGAASCIAQFACYLVQETAYFGGARRLALQSLADELIERYRDCPVWA